MTGVMRYAVAVVPLVLVPALGADQGGFMPDAWVWSATLAAWAAAVGLVLDPAGGRLRRGFWWPLLAAALLMWTAVSAVWSVEPSQSLLEARRTLVYAAVALALVALVRRGSTPALLVATHLAIAGLVLYALVRYLFGPRPFLEFEGHLLTEPLGYANAVGILAALGLVLSVAAAATAGSAPVRAAWAAACPLLALSLQLSGSNASWLALAAGLTALSALEPRRSELLATGALLLVPVAAAVWLGRHSGLAELGAARMSGAAVALGAAACAVAAALAVLLFARRVPRLAPGRRLAVAAIAIVVVVGAAAVGRGAATEPRRSYYDVAWHEYSGHPLLGSGAGTFGRYWVDSGSVPERGGALDAHSLYLETLAELGPVGLVLVCAFLLVPLRGAIGLRRLPGVPAAAAAVAAFLVHAGLDWDWELPAVVVAALACSAVVAFADPDDPEPAPALLRWGALAAAVAAGIVAIVGARSDATPSAVPETNETPHVRGLGRL
ncbi:MAG TPA: O-antigen ligase family protein [Gaiellaceae bacterium]|nr:O-antigen ligase family protein [Gaiellaceae bacterium]